MYEQVRFSYRYFGFLLGFEELNYAELVATLRSLSQGLSLLRAVLFVAFLPVLFHLGHVLNFQFRGFGNYSMAALTFGTNWFEAKFINIQGDVILRLKWGVSLQIQVMLRLLICSSFLYRRVRNM
jgi:hypothetical protein